MLPHTSSAASRSQIYRNKPSRTSRIKQWCKNHSPSKKGHEEHTPWDTAKSCCTSFRKPIRLAPSNLSSPETEQPADHRSHPVKHESRESRRKRFCRKIKNILSCGRTISESKKPKVREDIDPLRKPHPFEEFPKNAARQPFSEKESGRSTSIFFSKASFRGAASRRRKQTISWIRNVYGHSASVSQETAPPNNKDRSRISEVDQEAPITLLPRTASSQMFDEASNSHLDPIPKPALRVSSDRGSDLCQNLSVLSGKCVPCTMSAEEVFSSCTDTMPDSNSMPEINLRYLKRSPVRPVEDGGFGLVSIPTLCTSPAPKSLPCRNTRRWNCNLETSHEGDSISKYLQGSIDDKTCHFIGDRMQRNQMLSIPANEDNRARFFCSGESQRNVYALLASENKDLQQSLLLPQHHNSCTSKYLPSSSKRRWKLISDNIDRFDPVSKSSMCSLDMRTPGSFEMNTLTNASADGNPTEEGLSTAAKPSGM